RRIVESSRVPSIGRNFANRVNAVIEQFQKRCGIVCFTRETASDSDNGDRLIACIELRLHLLERRISLLQKRSIIDAIGRTHDTGLPSAASFAFSFAANSSSERSFNLFFALS